MRPWIPMVLWLALAGCADGDTGTMVGPGEPEDTDEDGLTDDREARYNTNPNNPDTDGDGLTDGDEVDVYLTDPNNPDYDNDGLSDGDEVNVHGTDPGNNDTDGDGLRDRAEIEIHKTDPTDDDTDGDDISDSDELDLGLDPTNPDTDGDGISDSDELEGITDPLKADTDGDGLSDLEEVEQGTDQVGPDTDGDTLSDGDEVNIHGTSPLLKDTDNDRLTDDFELEVGSDPTKRDTDDDGLNDAREIDFLGTAFDNPDTDGDGASDGVEVDEFGSDPLKTDTDGDGLSDGAEVNTHKTNPLEPDTDGDTLTDGEEVNLHKTDPLKTDTDGDTLDDAEEVNNLPTDPNKFDTDADGLSDAEEVNEKGTDPVVADTDGDGLLDGAEFTAGADPFLPDTDYGGVLDGAEVTDGTDPTMAADDLCTYPSVALDDPSYVPPTPAFDPLFVSFDWELVSNANGVHDYFFDANNDGIVDGGEERSAVLRVNLFGPEWNKLCEVNFEGDVATALDPLPAWNLLSPDGSASTASLVEALSLTPTTATTDCPALDAAVYGSDDIRTVLSALDFGFAFGGLDDLAGPLETEVDAAGDNWDADWASFVYGGWLSWDDVDAHLVNFGFVHDAVCEVVQLDGSGEALRQTGFDPLQPGQWSAGYAIAGAGIGVDEATFGKTAFFGFDEVTGISCDRASVSEASTTWSTGTTVMAATGVGFELDFAIEGDGSIGDFDADDDGDGTFDATAATVSAVFLDSAGAEVCRIVYDADAAVEIDPADWTQFDIDGTEATGLIDRAWELTLADGDGSTDCGTLDLANGWGDTDPEVVLEGLTFGFGIGALTTAGDAAADGSVTDWSTIKDDAYSVFVTFDGADADEAGFGRYEDLDDCFQANAGVYNAPGFVSEGRVGRATSIGSVPFVTFVP